MSKCKSDNNITFHSYSGSLESCFMFIVAIECDVCHVLQLPIKGPLHYIHGRLARWRKWRACDVEEKEGLKYELWRRWSNGRVVEWAELILQPFRHFIYVIAHSPTLPSLYLRHSSFSNPSVVLPTSHLILQPFFRFSYVTRSSVTSPGEPPMVFLFFGYNSRITGLISM